MMGVYIPEVIGWLQINESTKIAVYGKMPNRFHRMMAKLLLGWVYEGRAMTGQKGEAIDDLIRRQDAIEALIQEFYSNVDDYISEKQAVHAIDSLPSAQPEIIRCKDCKYASPNGKYGCKAYHFKLYETHEMNADDYCSRAERRTDE